MLKFCGGSCCTSGRFCGRLVCGRILIGFSIIGGCGSPAVIGWHCANFRRKSPGTCTMRTHALTGYTWTFYVLKLSQYTRHLFCDKAKCYLDWNSNFISNLRDQRLVSFIHILILLYSTTWVAAVVIGYTFTKMTRFQAPLILVLSFVRVYLLVCEESQNLWAPKSLNLIGWWYWVKNVRTECIEWGRSRNCNWNTVHPVHSLVWSVTHLVAAVTHTHSVSSHGEVPGERFRWRLLVRVRIHVLTLR